MTNHDRRHGTKGHGRFLAAVALLLFITTAALRWAWNGAGVNLFSLPEAGFMDVFSIVAAFVVAASLMLFLLRGGRR